MGVLIRKTGSEAGLQPAGLCDRPNPRALPEATVNEAHGLTIEIGIAIEIGIDVAKAVFITPPRAASAKAIGRR